MRVELRHGLTPVNWDRFAKVLLENMTDKHNIDEHEICGFVGASRQYICVDQENYIVVPIILEEKIIPYEIVVLRKDR